MKENVTPIPAFENDAEERAFWESTDSTDYVDWSKAERVRFSNLKPSCKSISPPDPGRSPGADQDRRQQAGRPVQSLIKIWLSEKSLIRSKRHSPAPRGRPMELRIHTQVSRTCRRGQFDLTRRVLNASSSATTAKLLVDPPALTSSTERRSALSRSSRTANPSSVSPSNSARDWAIVSRTSCLNSTTVRSDILWLVILPASCTFMSRGRNRCRRAKGTRTPPVGQRCSRRRRSSTLSAPRSAVP